MTCRDVPEIVMQRGNIEDALHEAADAMDKGFACRINRGDSFSAPSKPQLGEYLVSPKPLDDASG